MKRRVMAAGLVGLGLAIGGAGLAADGFQILNRFQQDAAPNVEKSYITHIQCGGTQYYIYEYSRTGQPNYRVIIPPNWGSPIGGQDYWSFEEALEVACNT